MIQNLASSSIFKISCFSYPSNCLVESTQLTRYNNRLWNLHYHIVFKMAANKYDKSELMLISDKSIDMTPIDGRVATVSEDGKWFITTPNQSYISEPTFGSNRRIIRRQDYRFGHDDYIQWPQAYNEKCPHHACILLRQESEKASSIQAGQGPKSLADSRLITTGGYDDDVHGVADGCSLGPAAMDYMEIYKPRMDGEEPSPPADQVAMTMGVFVFLPQVAAFYFKARLPFWMVQPMDSRSSQNVLSLINVTPPTRLVHVNLPPGQTIWSGAAGDIMKVLAIQDTAFGTMGYANPFNIDSAFSTPAQMPASDAVASSSSSSSTRPPSPTLSASSTSTRGSSRAASRGSKSRKPRKKNPYNADVEPPANQTFRVRLDAFQPISVPKDSRELFPTPIPSWQNALKTVNVETTLLIDPSCRGRNDANFMFPTISALIVGNADRIARQFTTWSAIREACIYRAISSSSQSLLLSHQDWRNFLNSPGSQNSMSLQDIFKGPFSDLGINASALQSLRPISLADKTLLPLDHRICRSGIDTEDHQERLQNALSPNPNSSSGLLVFDHTVATMRLASPSFTSRLEVLKSLRDLMLDWEVSPPPLLVQSSSDESQSYVRSFEEQLTKYYCQMFFNYFGRAASIPHSLHIV
ncbi:hypothetical protein BDN72DRAFT_945812 [Pluteus cervinus]|uniref:Uncharacterized protein n=1 Tax=Pluteus cervinus TaxID=181527 RepID=A0ACD3A274_9AGAR|nr:hypothetical protein BDN72DRAFT_945812 [Pluteus cervinus]